MVENTAAWLTAAYARPFEIKTAPVGVPEANQILIRNRAIAVNPIDGKLQSKAFYPLKYPTVLGEDVAGEVVSVGPQVTRFKPGDRVLGNTAGFDSKLDTEKAFQAYTILRTDMTSEIPDAVSYDRAVVLPLAVATASSGLFHPDFLGLQLPSLAKRDNTGQVVLIWGGASSVGSSAIQLAKAAGYEVITTASRHNFDIVTKLGTGAINVFDYNDGSVVADIVAALKGKTFVGVFDAVGGAAWKPCVDIVAQLADSSVVNKFVATVTPGFPEPPAGVNMKQVYALSILKNHVSRAIFEDFLPKALENGTFVPAPTPLVAGKGLESLQNAVDILNAGVSAKKVVVLLD
ncbi:hypothetical protein PV10_04519 [Exophiala mesophila]|uniref:Enoyl reductase (ER) domain-containing protein n=1 Tax=Exophiala mesophila TaxID=212818 RepID=A0A0D1ZHJ5_EXOME|nr:uncharacterized protein PV10_04519 [Exophiala mesophila]KIV93294.1 hypothetical protein PV10_04519 [Exophiala mesophila]